MWVNGEEVPEAKPLSSLALEAGDHRIRLKLVGSDDRLPIKVLVDQPWEALTKAGDWKACSPNMDPKLLA